MKLEILCKYCGYKTTRLVYSESIIENLRCDKCTDKNLVIKEVTQGKIDYYTGTQPFKEKTDKKEEPEKEIEIEKESENLDASDFPYWGKGYN